MTKFRLLSEWALLFLASIALVLFAHQQQWTQRVDAALLDLATEQRLDEPSDNIVLVEIDDRSLSEIGNWPWDRRRHAELIDALASYDARLVVMDILFIEQSDPEADTQLAEAIARAGNVVVPHTFAPRPGAVDGTIAVLPIEEIELAALNLGHVAVFPDPDGIVRRYEPLIETEGTAYPHLAVVTAAGGKVDVREIEHSDASPIAPMHTTGSYTSISAADVIERRIPAEFLLDKTVIVGATAQGLGDRYAVPSHAGRIMPGAEIQANFLDAARQDLLVYDLPDWIRTLVFLVAMAALFLAFWRLTPRTALYVSIGLIVLLIGLSVVLVVGAGLWLPVAPAILGIVVAYPLWGWRRLASVSRFLEAEARSLDGVIRGYDSNAETGFDTIAQQVSRIRGLIGATSERLTFLRQVLATSPDAMLVFDKDGALSLMNERAHDVFDARDQDAALTFSEMSDQVGALHDEQKGELTFNDGRVFLIARSPLDLGEESEVIALRDISGIRASENQRREMLEFLSHDMRSPQVAIIGLAGQMGNAMSQSDRFDRIENQARRTLKLTDDFVQIARLEYEGIEREDTDIGALLHEANDRAYPLAKRKHITLATHLPNEPEFCLVDPSALSRAIDNLIGNAIKFSPDGKTVSVTMRRPDAGSIEIEVSDEGPGLPTERMDDTFARFGAHNSRAGPSAGLGLAYVKKVVDEHNGTIDVRSGKDAGTRFLINLPCAGVADC